MAIDIKDRTVHTKCFSDAKREKQGFSLYEHFMLATQSGISGLWDLYDVTIESETSVDKKAIYNFSPLQKNLELTDAFNALSQFEMQQIALGHMARDEFSYPNATVLDESIRKNGYVRDVDSGILQPMLNGAIPEHGGTFTMDDIMGATTAILRKAENDERSGFGQLGNFIDTVIKPYKPVAVNYDAIFHIISLKAHLSGFYKALNAANQYLNLIRRHGRNILVTGPEGRINRDYDEIEDAEYTHICKNHIGSSLNNALKDARAHHKSFKLKEFPDLARFLDETMMAFELYNEVVDLQFALTDAYKNNNDSDLASIKKKTVNLCHRYRHKLSEEHLNSLERFCLDMFSKGTPEFLDDCVTILRQISLEIERKSEAFMKSQIKTGTAELDITAIMPKTGTSYRR